MKREIILSRLLDKYENSRHLFEPGASARRVMLRIGKKELPEYAFEDALIRDEFNQAAEDLAKEGLVTLEWIKGRPVLSCVILRLENVMQCYPLVGRIHPKTLADSVAQSVSEGLFDVSEPWIAAWRDEVCSEAKTRYKIPDFCKSSLLPKLLTAFREYDALHGESITMRAFSSKCYHDTKFFEREVREHFLRIAKKFHSHLANACEMDSIGVREQLAFLGIYARPELYELCGNCAIWTTRGSIDVSAAAPCGLALPSTGIDAIERIDLSLIRKVLFIENKTNYDEYLLSEQGAEELVVFHGGFLSPQKKKLFAKIAQSAHSGMEFLFWADIDLGGFRMFELLQSLIPSLKPMRMTGEFVEKYRQHGLVRTEGYLCQMEAALHEDIFPLFRDALQKCLQYGITIEQEVFLS